jgi:hypothetical protein
MQNILSTRAARLAVPAAIVLAIAAAALMWSQQGNAGAAAGDPTRPGVAVGPAATPGVQFSGSASRWDAIDQTDNPCTASTGYVDMPGMSVAFTSGTAHQRIIIMFQGEWIGGIDRALIRAVVDGVPLSGPGDAGAPFAPHEGTGVATNGFNFISDDVPSSLFHPHHIVKIQWASVGGESVCIDERSLVVLRGP